MEQKERVMQRVQEHYDELVKRGYNVVVLALQGSQNYDLDIYTDEYMSDVDTKAMVLPSLDDIVLNRAPVSTTIVLDNNEHIDVKDIRLMKEMFLKQNVAYLELLFSSYVVCNPDYQDLVEELYYRAEEVVLYNNITFYKSIKGMALEKLKALQHPYPTTLDKIEKFGYDPKQLHHIVRLLDLVTQLQTGVSFREALFPRNRDWLVMLKLGIVPCEIAVEMAHNCCKDLSEECDVLATEPHIRDEIKEFLNENVAAIIKRSIKNELGY
jgi:hypothetical protein